MDRLDFENTIVIYAQHKKTATQGEITNDAVDALISTANSNFDSGLSSFVLDTLSSQDTLTRELGLFLFGRFPEIVLKQSEYDSMSDVLADIRQLLARNLINPNSNIQFLTVKAILSFMKLNNNDPYIINMFWPLIIKPVQYFVQNRIIPNQQLQEFFAFLREIPSKQMDELIQTVVSNESANRQENSVQSRQQSETSPKQMKIKGSNNQQTVQVGPTASTIDALKASDDSQKPLGEQLKQEHSHALKDHECETQKPDCMFKVQNEEADVEGPGPILIKSERNPFETELCRDCNVVLKRLTSFEIHQQYTQRKSEPHSPTTYKTGLAECKEASCDQEASANRTPKRPRKPIDYKELSLSCKLRRDKNNKVYIKKKSV